MMYLGNWSEHSNLNVSIHRDDARFLWAVTGCPAAVDTECVAVTKPLRILAIPSEPFVSNRHRIHRKIKKKKKVTKLKYSEDDTGVVIDMLNVAMEEVWFQLLHRVASAWISLGGRNKSHMQCVERL